MPSFNDKSGPKTKMTLKRKGCAQSHYREVPREEDFYGTGIEIWDGLGLIGRTEKKGLGRL